MGFLERLSIQLGQSLKWVAAVSLVAMMLLTCADVIMRFFNRPIPGTYEIVSFLAVPVAAFALAYTQIHRGHVSIDFLVDKLHVKHRFVVKTVTNLLSIGLFALLAWQSCCYATDLRLSGVVSPTERIPYFPLMYGIAFACIPLCLLLLLDLIKSFSQVGEK